MGLIKTTLQLLVAAIADAAEAKANKIAAWRSVPDDVHFPSEKLVKDSIDLATKPPCRIAVIDSITLSGLQVVQSVSLVVGNRILKASGIDGGIYVVASGAWTRALDFAASSQVKGGVLIPVSEGTYANTVFCLTTNDPITLGTTELVFALPALQSYYLIDTGSVNAISVTIPAVPALTSWTQMIGIRMAIYMGHANTGATTLAVTGLSGAQMVKKNISVGLVTGDLLATGIYEFIYDGVNFQIRLPEKGDTGIAGDGALSRYYAKITQSGTNAPVEDTVYVNTTGQTLTNLWSYDTVGLWALTGGADFGANPTLSIGCGSVARLVNGSITQYGLSISCRNIAVNPTVLANTVTFYLQILIYP